MLLLFFYLVQQYTQIFFTFHINEWWFIYLLIIINLDYLQINFLSFDSPKSIMFQRLLND